MAVVLMLTPDESGAAWLDAQSPVTVHTEKTSPHRIALKTSLKNVTLDDQNFDTWLRIDRMEAHKLVDQLTLALRESADNGAEGITTNLNLELILNGGAESSTGKLALIFKAVDGRTYRILISSDQSGLLSDMVAQAAASSAKIVDKKLADAGGGVAKVTMFPRDAEVIRLQKDALTGKEILNVRLPNGLEYSFSLSDNQAKSLRESPPPEATPNPHFN